jgi:TRAP-type C4-dicarboxylate transport system substrate-binding protein
MRSIITALCLMSLLGWQSASAVTFKMATVAPNGSAWMTEIQQAAATIKQQTDGRVKFKFYTGGVMGSARSVLKKIRIGQLHGGAFTIGDLSTVYPDIQVYSLPFLFRSYAEVDYVRARMDPVLQQGLAKQGMESLGMSDGGFAYFMSDTAIRSIDTLRHKKVWLPEGDPIIQTVFDTIGLAAVPLSLADVYTGLQTGMIDTIGTSTSGAIAFQWHTKVKYVTDYPLVYLMGNLVLDQKALNRISPADQAIVKQVMHAAMDKLGEINRRDNQAARQALQQQGIQFISIGPEERQRVQALAQKSIQRLIAQGVFSHGMYQHLASYLQTYRSQHPATAHAR